MSELDPRAARERRVVQSLEETWSDVGDGRTGDGHPELQDSGDSARIEALLRAIERLENTIALETDALHANAFFRLSEFNRSKSLGLLELSRVLEACRLVDRKSFEAHAQKPLGRLRDGLERNLAELRTRLRAIDEITSIISRCILDRESDGTYTTTVMRQGVEK